MKSVKYQLDITDVSAHLISVTLSFTPSSPVHELMLPAWIPGSYMIRDFARNIVAITARDKSGVLQLRQLDKQRWQLQCNDSPVTVSYQLYAYDLSVRAAYIDDEVAVLNPASLCLSVNTLEALPHRVNISKPQSRVIEDWQVATGLSRSQGTDFLGFGEYSAANYQVLIDSPILLGKFTLTEFVIEGISHYLVVTGDNLTNLGRFTADLTRICQQQVNVFGSLPADLTSYWFLLWVTEDGYGGLEHLNSTLLLCSRFDLPAPEQPQVDENYQNLLALCSHEYFHTWWVKRLKPAVFQQYQLTAEQYTRQLWLYEGFTSYYDDLALVRAGLIDSKTYIKTLEKAISRVTRNPSDSQQSLIDSSFTAWTKFYKQDENAVNAVVSYYAKGALLALCLDASLRSCNSSLDDVVRQLWQRYLVSGTPDNALHKVLTELGFAELATESDKWLTQAAALPLAELLPTLGLTLTIRPMQHGDDFGGEASVENLPFIGAQTKPLNGLLQLTQVYHGGSAHQAGLMSGDQLLALDNRKISPTSLPQLLKRYPEGSTLTLHFYRKDRLLQSQLTLNAAQQQVAVLTVAEQAQCDSWLQQALPG
ncbi:Predicted metalloprotease, contains C-terminal PDZ domain [Rheinheimera pacifica]|uniref:Predicted metalloprotease, contains C-terminal PDZ domain n=1 Tax=Rheinheimera pacifica TaxID=173990 RepID=A0A1H6LM95_9GAMM|nr:PDZ domain-containing protein [Rheinheimera pacifica]SEH89727.1 Predicted metalloprotease, contains C-terminal PDZ domain [Rheinheimera pacifica]